MININLNLILKIYHNFIINIFLMSLIINIHLSIKYKLLEELYSCFHKMKKDIVIYHFLEYNYYHIIGIILY